MTDVSVSPVVCHDVETSAGGGRAASGAAGWLGLAAAPTFAIMALWTELVQRPAGHDVHGDARLIADEWNDGDVSADERVPRSAVVQGDLQPTNRRLTAIGLEVPLQFQQRATEVVE